MIKDLSNTDVKEIVDCLHSAFSDYAIPMKMPQEYWQSRWEMVNIDYSLSFGVYDQSRLVGFILHGVDILDGSKTAYNMATGVIPEFRGQRLVKQMYDHSLSALKAAQCASLRLEVLTDNTKAIKAYQSAGFHISDEMLSYQIPLDLKTSNQYKLIKRESWSITEYKDWAKHKLSFEHRDIVIERDQDKFNCFELHNDDKVVAYGISKKANDTLVQFAFKASNNSLKTTFFAALKQKLNQPRIVNISTNNTELIQYFDAQNFHLFIKQYEMVRWLD